MLDYLSVSSQKMGRRRRGGLTLKYHLSFDGMNRYDLYLKVMRLSVKMVGLLCNLYLSAFCAKSRTGELT